MIHSQSRTEVFEHINFLETVFVPTFPYMWQCIEHKLQIEEKIKYKLKRSIAELPKTLQPLLNKTASLKTVAEARILFFNYAQKTGIARTLSESKFLQKEYVLRKNLLRTELITWFTRQTLIHQQADNVELSDQLQQYLNTNELTIANLLVIDPTIFYKIPGML